MMNGEREVNRLSQCEMEMHLSLIECISFAVASALTAAAFAALITFVITAAYMVACVLFYWRVLSSVSARPTGLYRYNANV